MKAKAQLDASGAGANGGLKFKVLNGNPSGIVQSDRLEVEMTFAGPEWRAVIAPLLEKGGTAMLPLKVLVDDTVHSTELPLKITDNHVVAAGG